MSEVKNELGFSRSSITLHPLLLPLFIFFTHSFLISLSRGFTIYYIYIFTAAFSMSSRYTSAFQARRRGKQKARRPPTSHPLSGIRQTETICAGNVSNSDEAETLASEAIYTNSKQATGKDESQNQHSQTQSVSHTTTSGTNNSHLLPDNIQTQDGEPSLTFDDANVELLHASDSSLEWDQMPFDYVVPMDRPMYHERYSFERNQGSSIFEQAEAASRRLIRRISETSDGIGRAFVSGSSQAAGTSEQAREYLKRAGNGVGSAVKQGANAVKDGLELIKESSRALPALQARRSKKSGSM